MKTRSFSQEVLPVVELPTGELVAPQADADGHLKTAPGGSAAKGRTAFAKTVAVAGTAEPLVAAPTYVRAWYVKCKQATGANAGKVYLGDSAVNRTTSQQLDRGPGDEYGEACPAGVKVDLATIFIDADNAGDGVVGWYIEA